ncbi:hypothetical protein J2Z79_001755 [Symbiobacterium terraclitae]|uniref:DUF1648 domain-containing protein n=1 Tax=Symbiobacterium terraclitae TaxID=557451 RepID=A0ABS4JS36_9FIRM|nr:hypothetical protein [Symbiobacterium terraclitae]MBP2018347.1 hypothetical protein [Symbiobacterium terraclitae]
MASVARALGTGLLVALAALILFPGSAAASHLSGGESDLMGLYGGIALVLGFGGLLGVLGLVPRRWRRLGHRYGRWLLAIGLLVLVGGGFHASAVGVAERRLGDEAWGRLATQQLLGTLVVFVSFWGGVYYLASRTGVLNMGESVKYVVLRNGDPPEPTASRVARPGEQRLMWIPFAAMGILAVCFTVGVLVAIFRIPPGARL